MDLLDKLCYDDINDSTRKGLLPMMNKIKRHLARFDLLAKYPMEEYGYSKLWLFWD